MKIHWHTPGVQVYAKWRAEVEDRIHAALSRFGQRIVTLDLYLSDENGPRGGVDKNCRLIAKLSPYGLLAVQDRDSDLSTLIDRAVERLARSVRRELERRRTQSTRTLWENG